MSYYPVQDCFRLVESRLVYTYPCELTNVLAMFFDFCGHFAMFIYTLGMAAKALGDVVDAESNK